MDTMEKVLVCKDLKSFECSSLSELDRRFFGEQSLLSALSLEHLSISKSSNETVADGSGNRGSVMAYLCLSTDIVSPCREFSFLNFNMQEVESCNLTVPSQGRFSTPNTMVQNPKLTCFEQLSGALPASPVSWDVSLIKAEGNSPRFFMDSSAVEQTLSPKVQNQSLAEVSL